MNPVTLADARLLLSRIRKVTTSLERVLTIVFPPYIYAHICTSRGSSTTSRCMWGVQDVFYEQSGAFTGAVSASMVHDMGGMYAIVGHSERRAQGDTDAVVARKARAALEARLKPIICVGELRRDEHNHHLSTLKAQIEASLEDIDASQAKNIIIAYEPVWAIGASQPMTNALIQESTIFVRRVLADFFGPENGREIPVLYGGSVNMRNAADIVREGQVDGLLVGRESVNAAGFVELLRAVEAVAA